MRNVFDRLHSEGSASASRSVPLLQSLDRCGDDIGDLGSRYVRLPHPAVLHVMKLSLTI